MKPVTPLLRSTRLLGQVREQIRYLHCSLKTEKAYLYWIRFFIRWCAKQSGMRHPRDMGVNEVEAFLSMLANERKESASTHNQALSALLFLYREVLAKLIYGTGMRLMEGMRLRVKDVRGVHPAKLFAKSCWFGAGWRKFRLNSHIKKCDYWLLNLVDHTHLARSLHHTAPRHQNCILFDSC